MAKKLNFYTKYIKPCFTPESKADFIRREKISKTINLINIIVFSGLIGIMIWKLISAIALVFFEYDLGWLLELCFSTLLTWIFINPLSGKLMDFSRSFNTNLVWVIFQALGILYLINILGLGIQKVEHKTE